MSKEIDEIKKELHEVKEDFRDHEDTCAKRNEERGRWEGKTSTSLKYLHIGIGFILVLLASMWLKDLFS